MMDMCKEMGMECRNFDYYCMDATYGEGDEVIASLSHLDIVPIGEGWEHGPFDGEMDGDIIYGRGTNDDKGPLMASVYAVKALLDAGVTFNRKIRLIFGCDEECGMSDMRYYLEKCKAPDYAFSPDACFPAVHAEKTILGGAYKTKIEAETIVKKIFGGSRTNVVPESATALVTKIGTYHNDPDIVIEDKEGFYQITATGKSAHASTPEEGKSAIMILCKYLMRTLPKDDAYKEICTTLYDSFKRTNGRGLDIQCEDKPTGALTINLGTIDGDSQNLSCQFDIRHPVTLSSELTHKKLQTGLNGFELEAYKCSNGLYWPKDHPLIKTLQGVYRKVTGDKQDPVSMGGGTYARTLPCAVAFGPGFPNGKAKGAHMPDECASVDELITAARIYAHSLYELANM
jgi:succinyl-diaminopimelate desuccinylase